MSRVASAVAVWAEMIKLTHSVFALPFALVATFLAARQLDGGLPGWGRLGLVALCMVSARSVAMTFNRIVDCEIDARNPRTAGRPLPEGRLRRGAAWTLLGLSAVTFGLGCLGFHVVYENTWPILLSGPLLLYLCGYSLTKRVTRWSHLYLGTAVALSPAAAWIAVHPPSLGWEAVLLSAAVACWIAGFDVIYACQDVAVDRRDRLHSLPADLGERSALRIARVLHVLALLGLIGAGVTAELGVLYYAGVAVVALLLWVEHSIVRPGDHRRVNAAFFTINGVVSLVLAATAIGDVLLFGRGGP
jgi:4-hydroxybenzoate polyprenyltransferase